MEYIELGKTGVTVSRIGFGGIPIQRIDAEAAVSLFKRVTERGITYVDTARGYTVSEEYIGYAIQTLGVRDRLFIATKSMARDYAGMSADIDKSMTNLRTDYIDLYQVHNPSMSQLDDVLAADGALAALLEAKAKGRIGHIGVTAHSLDVFKRALSIDEFETIMFPYSIVETQAEELISRCAECGKAFIAMKPLAGGAIEDGAAAIRFLLTNPSVSVIIPGMYSEDEVDENASFTSAPLTEPEQMRVADIRAKLTGNFCRRCGYCAPCTVGINIPGVFLFHGYLDRYGLETWARSRYNGLAAKAGDCIRCGQCEPRCPYHLPIREMMAKACEAFGE